MAYGGTANRAAESPPTGDGIDHCLSGENGWLLEQLKLSKKKLFGRSSEQAEQMVMEQLSFTYNEAEAYASGT